MKRKVLCVCNGGNVRSVAAAELFKGTFGCEAIAASTYWLSMETMITLCNWADTIAPVEDHYGTNLPQPDKTKWEESIMWSAQFAPKLKVLPIGPDIYGHKKFEELKVYAAELIRKWL